MEIWRQINQRHGGVHRRRRGSNRRCWNVSKDLRYRNPIRHSFALRQVRWNDASGLDVLLNLREAIGTEILFAALHKIFHRFRLYDRNLIPALSRSTVHTSITAQTQLIGLAKPRVRTVNRSCAIALLRYPA